MKVLQTFYLYVIETRLHNISRNETNSSTDLNKLITEMLINKKENKSHEYFYCISDKFGTKMYSDGTGEEFLDKYLADINLGNIISLKDNSLITTIENSKTSTRLKKTIFDRVMEKNG